ncbi:hypothetical protein Mgra_00000724 [Meloidogyne graminicola]|uniref:Uncharacterized protein n=1 Tax=Meloidogyne graminicola TaxID=189291 RepID=A0A8T0A170_9BILA|nr:hypothetical protein Mgra_00000724 [Meloidogyne graminicola]
MFLTSENFRIFGIIFFELIVKLCTEMSSKHFFKKSFFYRDWLSQLKIHAYCETPDIILCGNKSDLENRRQVSTARAKQLADQLGLPYFETSACTSSNVEKSVDCLLDLVMQRIQMSVSSDNLPAGCIGSGNRLNVEEEFNSNKSPYYCNNC